MQMILRSCLRDSPRSLTMIESSHIYLLHAPCENIWTGTSLLLYLVQFFIYWQIFIKMNSRGLCLRVDSFATYAYSCRICLVAFFIVFRLKSNEKFQQANATATCVCCK